jgi:DNA-binding MarR family transcriptional regulator
VNYSERLARISPHLMVLTGFFHGVVRSVPGAGADVRTNVVRYHILKGLGRRGPHHPTELSGHLRVKKNTLSELLDRMVRDGLVKRAFAADDRRKVLLSLTAKGRTAVREYQKVLVDHIIEFLNDFSESDRRQLVVSLERLIRILGKRARGAGRCGPF